MFDVEDHLWLEPERKRKAEAQMQTLNQDIKEKRFKRAYLLFGQEAFLIKSYKHRLKEAILGDDTMNYHYFEGKGLNLSEIISLADTMPFFGERRLIMLEDSGLLKSGGDELAEYLPQMPESTCMIFVESEVDKRCRLYKAVTKIGYAAQLDHQDSAQLARWAAGILKQEGKQISGQVMELFLLKAGEDMENIRSELEKLISYTLGRQVITAQDVEDICTTQVTNKIFDMITAISSRKTRQAMELYEDLLILREPPMRILFLIARQFNQLLMVRDMMGKNIGRGEMASKLKLPPFVVGKMTVQAKAFSRDQILSYVSLCVEMEEEVKLGKLSDRMAVELLICRRG